MRCQEIVSIYNIKTNFNVPLMYCHRKSVMIVMLKNVKTLMKEIRK